MGFLAQWWQTSIQLDIQLQLEGDRIMIRMKAEHTLIRELLRGPLEEETFKGKTEGGLGVVQVMRKGKEITEGKKWGPRNNVALYKVLR
jgi:hypothetical protein